MNVWMAIDKKAYSQKPKNNYEFNEIKTRTRDRWGSVDLAEAARLIGDNGHAFLPGHLVGGNSASNCVGMQVFGLDFDDGITFAEIQKRCERYHLPIAFAYHTFRSSEEQERFRVVFVHETLIEDMFIVKIVMQIFHKLFPESDKNCTNPDRLYLGGKRIIYCDETAAFALVQLLPFFHKALDENQHYKRNLENFCSKQKILMINNKAAMGDGNVLATLVENGDFTDSAIIHIIGETTKSPFFVIERGKHQSNIRQAKIKQKRIDISSGNSGCHLLDDFLSGIEVNHQEKYIIITNLRHINGGEKMFLGTLEKYYDEETLEKWKTALKYMCGYKPMRCSADVCPYFASCYQSGTILDTLSTNRKVYKTREEVYYPLEEAVTCLKENLEAAYRHHGIGIHLIKAQTSIGKTTQYIDLIRRYSKDRFLIALPTNILKKQVTEDLERSGIAKTEIFMTSSVSDSAFFKDEWERIKEAHKKGIHHIKTPVLKETLEKIKKDPDKRAIVEECERLIEGIDGRKDERVIVTTHAALMQMPDTFLSQFTVIIDEDILQLAVFNQIYTVSIECLKRVKEYGIPGYAQIAGQMLAAKEKEYRKISSIDNLFPLSEEQMMELACGADDNVNDMKKAEAFVKVKDLQSDVGIIKYFCPHKFSAQKYIILSATLNENVYRRYFNGMMSVYAYETKSVAYRGKVIQYTYHSLGRRDLSGKMEVFGFARRIAGQEKLEIITFKEGNSIKGVSHMNTKDLHFGNTTGINSLSGKNLGVVGTPYRVEESYKLVAAYLGADVNQEIDANPRLRRVEYKGYSFCITTYHNELLREVQLYALESELEQCVGRARLLRNDCTVYVFSAFPCEQAEMRMGNYLQN